MIDIEKAFFYLDIALAILLPFTIWRLADRERYAQVLIKRQKHRMENLLRLTPKLIRYTRMLTWLSLLCLVPVQLTLYYYFEVSYYITIIYFLLSSTSMFMYYRFEKWLYQYLTYLYPDSRT